MDDIEEAPSKTEGSLAQTRIECWRNPDLTGGARPTDAIPRPLRSGEDRKETGDPRALGLECARG